ncbi:MAG: tetratricopeptide repeat protein [Bacteroidota bacterium]
MPSPNPIQTQINYARVQGNLVVQGDAVINEAEKITYPRILTRLPRLREKLIGRDKELQQLADQLQSGQNFLLMNGMGGVGKTTLATAYANQYQDRYTHICWLEQQGDFANSLVTDGDLLASLRYEPTDAPQQDAKNLLRMIGELGRGHRSLLVIDNAEASLKDYIDYLPAAHWEVLVTSREKIFGLPELAIDNLELAPAKALFQAHYQLDQQEQALEQIIELVDRHTLTLELLAKTAQARRIQPLAKVYDLLEERGLAIGRRVGQEVAHSKGHEVEKIFPYLQAIFEWSETSEEETWLLKQFLFLPPSFHSFERLAELLLIAEEDEEKWDQLSAALEGLVAKGWIAKDTKLGFKLHRVLKEVLFEQLRTLLSFEEVGNLAEGVLELLSYDYEMDNPISLYPLINYGESFLESCSAFNKDYLQIADLKDTIGILLAGLGRYEKARELAESAVEVALAIDKTDESRRLSPFSSNLALVYKALGRYQDAVRLLQFSLRISEGYYGLDDPRTKTRQNNLASVLQELDRQDEAAELLESVWEFNERTYGLDHPSTAKSQSNLAVVYIRLARYEEAAALLEAAIQTNEQSLGKDHPNVAICQSNLAMVYQRLNRNEEALEFAESAFRFAELNYGTDHPNTAMERANLGTIYRSLGRHEAAAAWLESALASDERNFGVSHPSTIRCQTNLAVVYTDLGRHEEAAALSEQVLRSTELSFGADHPKTAERQTTLAFAYHALGRYSEAAALLELVLRSNRANYGADHPETAMGQSSLGSVYFYQLGKKDEGLALVRDAIITLGSVLGPDHPRTKSVKNLLDSME